LLGYSVFSTAKVTRSILRKWTYSHREKELEGDTPRPKKRSHNSLLRLDGFSSTLLLCSSWSTSKLDQENRWPEWLTSGLAAHHYCQISRLMNRLDMFWMLKYPFGEEQALSIPRSLNAMKKKAIFRSLHFFP
jgi:hypothetical protein